MRRILEGIATGGNAQEGNGVKKVGDLGKIGTEPTREACMGDNGPNPERERRLRGIGLFKVAWKVCAAVLNLWLKRCVVLQDSLHRFRVGQGTRTDTLEANMDQHIAGLANKPLFQVF